MIVAVRKDAPRTNTNFSEEKNQPMISAIKNLVKDDSGATLVEYGLVLALIALVCIGVLTTLGHSVSTMFSSAASEL
jgi:pilus assembly protein Flp/PilA